MRKLFFLAALCALSIGAFAADVPSNPGQGEEVLPYSNPDKTVVLADGTYAPVYSSTLVEDNNTRYFVTPKPIVRADKETFFNPETKQVSFGLSLDYRLSEIAKRMATDKPIIGMPIVSYEVALVVNNTREVVACTEKNAKHNVMGNIPICAEIEDPKLICALEKNPKMVGIDVTFMVKFKDTKGGGIRIGNAISFRMELEEKLFGSMRDTIYIPKSDLEGLLRDVVSGTQASIKNGSSVVIQGSYSHDMQYFVNRFLDQNKELWKVVLFEDGKEFVESWIFYDKSFGTLELHPEVVNNVINNSEKSDEMKSKVITSLSKLSEVAKSSKDIHEFFQKLSESDEYSLGASYCGFGVNGSYKTTSSDEKRTYNQHDRDTYDMLKSDSFNAEEYYKKTMEKLSGSMKQFFTAPKNMNIIRLNKGDLNELTNFYCQQVDSLDSWLEPCVEHTCLSSAAEMQATNEIVENLEAQVKDLQARLDSTTTKLEKCNVEAEDLKSQNQKLLDILTRDNLADFCSERVGPMDQ